RKHGLRFGQYTIFMPLLLKPAPTRLRLVLWSLAQGLDDFPEPPPPGLVTIPANTHAPKGYDTMCGYRIAGERAIRIDMLERLADLLRGEDSRGGFEAKPDMLSITGMTLEQFAALMEGLGYRAEKGERAKVKPVDQVVADEEGAAPVEGDSVPVDDTPLFDRAHEAPEGVAPDAAETPEPADAPEPVQALDDHGEAPVASDPAEETDAGATE
ncbi:disulfide oxidoreductase, partial [Cribrihabitans sp. XS_ASV171]